MEEYTTKAGFAITHRASSWVTVTENTMKIS